MDNTKLRETYNTIAEEWHRDHQSDTWWQTRTDEFLSQLKPHARVLDAGCAGGYKAAYIGARGFDVMGIDLSDAFITIARHEQPHRTFLQMNLKDLETLPGLFDGIYTAAVLLHIPKKEVLDIVEKFWNKLEDNGYLYLAVKEQRPGGVEEEVKTEVTYGYPYERFFSYYTKNELHEYLEHSKFKIISEDIQTVGNTSWIQIIAQKYAKA